MTEWKEYKLGEIADVQTGPFGSQLHMSDYQDEGTPIITVEHLGDNRIIHNNLPLVGEKDKNRLKKYVLAEGDIVFSRVGSVDRRAYVSANEDGWMFSGRCLRVRPTQEVDSKFLSYYFGLEDFKETIRRIAVGATMPSINTTILSNVVISLPPIDTQQRIASILSSLDDKIDLLHRENKTLETMAETLFRQWFIEEAKEDWEEKHLSDYVIDTLGGDWGKENPEGDFVKPVQCIRGTDIADLNVGLAYKTPIRFVKESKYDKIHPKTGDIIMEISGGTESQSTGRVAYINNDVIELFDYPLVFSNFCRLLRMEEKYTYFIYSYLQYLYKQDEFFNLENGSSGIKNLDYKALLYDLTYPMPSENRLIVEYNEKVSLYFRKINKNKKQIQTLTQQRDGLLPKLMSGEVKI